MKGKEILSYLVILGSIILLILNLIDFDFKNLNNNNYSGILSNILLFIAMILNISSNKKMKV
jgi:hypothetical protein